MKVFVPTRAIEARLRTHLWLMNTGADFTYVCHEVGDSFTLAKHGIPMDNIVICNPPNIGVATIGWIRQWIEDNLVEDGEWYVMLDDDVFVSKLPDPWWQESHIPEEQTGQEMRSLFEKAMHVNDFLPMVREIQAMCRLEGTILGGITWNENYFFRLKKWKTKAFVCGGFTVTQKHPKCPWLGDHHQFMGEDVVRCVRVMERFGKIVLNQFATIGPLGSQDDSSIGPLAVRRTAWEETRKWLCQTYSLLVTSKEKPNGEHQLVWKSDDSIRRHREFLKLT